MAITITVPDTLAEYLRQQAQAQQRSAEEVALGILREALDPAAAFPIAVEVVARIKATKPGLHSLRPARGSLAGAVRAMPEQAGFDLAQWQAEWAVVEAEMHAMARADDLAEGRG